MTLSEIAAGVAAVAAKTVSVAESVYSFVTGGVNTASDYSYSASSAVTNWLGTNLDKVQELINEAVDPLKSDFIEGLKVVGNALTSAYGSIGTFIDDKINWLDKKNEAMGNWILGLLGTDIKELEKGMGKISDEVYSYLAPKIETVKEIVEGIPISIEHFVSAMTGVLMDLTNLMPKLFEYLGEKMNNILTLDETKMDDYLDSIMKLQEKLQEKWKQKSQE